MTGATAIGTFTGIDPDDQSSGMLPIGFTFRMNGTDYTTFSVSTNGVLRLGNTASTSFNNATAFPTTLATPSVMAFFDDQRLYGYPAAGSGYIQYLTTGTSPNRVLTVEWNAGLFSGSNTIFYTYQVRLYEGSNKIEFIYLSMPTSQTTSATIGALNSSTDFVSITPGSPATASSTTANNAVDVATTPIAANTMYTLAPVCPTITTQPTGSTVCMGNSVSFTVAASGTGPLTYQWRFNGTDIVGATGTTYTIANPQPSDAGNYDVVVTGGCSPATSNPATLVVNTPPVITAQPAPISVCEGQPAILSVNATGTNLTYQWRRNGVNIFGGNNQSYSIPAAGQYDDANYDVVISGTCPPAVTSNTVHVTVNKAPQITAQPTNETVCQGQGTTFSVTALGTNLTYQWRFNGSNIPGATGTQYNIPNAQPANGGSYDVIVSGTCAPPATSFSATLTVNTPPTITSQPVNTTTCQGVPVTFSVGATGTNLTYQWRKNSANIPGATGSTFTIANPQPADTGNYEVVVSGTCSPSVTSNTVKLTVNTLPTITQQPTNQVTCQNSPTTFTVAATGTSLTYQWRKGGVNIAGANGTSYTIASTQPADAGNYDVVVSGACAPPATSNTVTLTVNTAPVISQQPTSVTTCQNTPATFTVAATGTGPFTYQWRKDGTPIPGATASSYTIPSVQPTDAGVYSAVVSGPCAPPATSNGATLTVNTPPSITSLTPSSSACLNTPFTFSVGVSGTGPFTYQWRKNGINIAGATASTYTIPSVQVTDAASYSVVVTGICSPPATSANSVLTVLMPPSITQQPVGLTVCEGQSASFTVVATGAGLSYQWRKDGVNIPGATGSTYTIPSVTPANAGDYTVVVFGTCQPTPVTSAIAKLTVNLLPRITASPLSQAVCRTRPVTFNVTATGTGITYQWRKNGVAIPGATAASYTIPAIEPKDAGNYDVVVSGVCAPPATSSIAVLTVNVEPVLFKWTESQTRAAGQPVTFSIIATGTALRYQWWKGNQPIPGANSSSYTIPSVSVADAGVYAVEVSNMCSIASETSGGMFLFVGDGTTEIAMPADIAVCSGQKARFVAPGTMDQFRYQWMKNGVEIAGATSPVLEFASTEMDDAASYTVEITDKPTGATMVTKPATLSVSQGTKITGQPQNMELCFGEKLTLKVDALGNGLSYQWRKNGMEIPGATSATYELPSTVSTNAGTYDVVVNGSCGDPVVSSAASVSILAPTSISEQPQSRSVAKGQSVSFAVVATGVGLEYQWRKDGLEIGNATAPNYTIASAGPEDAGRYDVVITSECGTRRISDPAVLAVQSSSAVPGGPSIAEGVKMVVMPHPAHGATRVELTLPAAVRADAKSTLALYDMKGVRVLDLNASFSNGSFAVAEFDAATLASGLYHVRLETAGWSGSVGSIVIEK
jgi:hypothetical protein